MKANKLIFLPFIALSLVSCGGGNEPVSTTTSETPSTTSSESKDIQEVIKTIAEVNRMDHGVPVELKARVIAINKTMAIIYDGTGSLNVYAGYNHTFKVDDKYLFEGNTVLYNGVHQLEKETMTFSPTTGDIAEFDYAPTEITSLDDYDGKVGKMVTIKGEICYASTSGDTTYYNGEYLPGDTELALSITAFDDDYLSEFENTDKHNRVALDVTGILVGIKYSSASFGGTSYANIILTEKAVDTSLEVKELTVSDSMAEFYTMDNVYASDNNLVVNAKFTNNAELTLLKNKYTYKVYDSKKVEINVNEKFPINGEYSLVVTYKGVDKETILNVDVTGIKTVVKTPQQLHDLNNWGTGNTSNKTGIMDDFVSLKAVGSGTGKYSEPNNTWSIVQKTAAADKVDNGYLEIKINDDLQSSYNLYRIKITYYPNEGDTVGHFEGLASDELKVVNAPSIQLTVKGETDEITNAVVRIRSILVQYKAL